MMDEGAVYWCMIHGNQATKSPEFHEFQQFVNLQLNFGVFEEIPVVLYSNYTTTDHEEPLAFTASKIWVENRAYVSRASAQIDKKKNPKP